MKLLPAITVGLLVLTSCQQRVSSLGDDDAKRLAATETTAEGTVTRVQFFNEKVLGELGTTATTTLLPADKDAWSPKTIALDYENGLCYGAIVHYPKTASFEELRSAINGRFKTWESTTFASDPTMGIWRNEDEGFTIQLTEDDDSFQAIYVRWAEAEIVSRKIEEAFEDPEILREFLRDDDEREQEREADGK
jgi:hypothetical protein